MVVTLSVVSLVTRDETMFIFIALLPCTLKLSPFAISLRSLGSTSENDTVFILYRFYSGGSSRSVCDCEMQTYQTMS